MRYHLEVWKAINVEDYPLKIHQQSAPPSGMATRATLKGIPIEIFKSNTTKNTSTSDAIRIWNLAPENVTEAKTLYQVKKTIKEYVKRLPL